MALRVWEDEEGEEGGGEETDAEVERRLCCGWEARKVEHGL